MSIPFKVEEIEFIKEDIPVDHFTLPLDELERDGFKVRWYSHSEGIGDTLSQTFTKDGESAPLPEFLTKEELGSFSHIMGASEGFRQTVVYDIQVGKGKTTAFYDIISDLYQDESNIILVLSPFKKLVEKDYKALKGERGIDAFCYLDFKKMSVMETEDLIINALDKRVHVMSINCLLRNPGEDVFEQATEKTNYLDRLFIKCNKERKKVYMFFDEIHESIHNFKPTFLPYLMKWEAVVKSCYVSTATYTVASYPVIKYIASLTDNNILYVYYPREKWRAEKVSKIHLHVVNEEYSGQNLDPLIYLKTLLEDNLDKQVNILAATKSLVSGLTANKIKGKENPFYETINKFNFNEVTGGTSYTEKKFDSNKNNIGTVFKTGVSIEKPDSVFIIILPTVSDIFSEKGIFTDGLPSMIQAMARLRKSGNIHVFMYKPQNLIEPKYTVVPKGDPLSSYWAFETYTPLKDRLPATFTKHMVPWTYRNQFDALELLLDEYDNELRKVKAEVAALNVRQQQQAINLGFQYPSFEQFTMEGGGQKLVNKYVQFGGDLSSLMLWACMNGQFVNADLEKIYFHSKNSASVELVAGSFKDTLIQYIPTKVIDSIKTKSFVNAYPILEAKVRTGKSLDEMNDTKASDCIREFTVDGRDIPFSKLKITPEFMQTLMWIYLETRGVKIPDDKLKDKYIKDSIKQAMNTLDDNILVKAYQGLYEVRHDFLKFLKTQVKKTSKGREVVRQDAYLHMPINIVEDVQDIMGFLVKEDPFIKNNAVSLWQKIVDKDPKVCLKTVYLELKNLFTNISTERVPINKVREYNPIEGPLEKALPTKPVLYYFKSKG